MLTLTPRRFTVTLDTKQGRIVFDNKDQGLNLKLVQVLVPEGLPGPKGDDGDSAYQVAVGAGFSGDVNAWLASLVGPKGDDGDNAYQVAVGAGFSGDVNAWLASLVGPKGDDGDKGDQGDKGDDGDKGDQGDKGDDGDSAYQVAVGAGFSGDVNAWLATLVGPPGADSTVPGPPGDSAYQVAVDNGFSGDVTAWLASLIGPPGADSTVPGPAGDDAYEVAVANGFVGDVSAWLDSLVGPPGADGEVTYADLGTILADFQPLIASGNTGQFYRGDKAFTNVLEGNFGIVENGTGTGATSQFEITRKLSATGAGVRRGIYLAAPYNLTNTNTVAANYIETAASQSGSAVTLLDLRHFYATQGALAGTISRQAGFVADSTLSGGISNYGFYGNLAANGSLNWNFYAPGTAPSYFAGAINQGTTTITAGINFRSNKTLTGTTAPKAFVIDGAIQSDVTGAPSVFSSEVSVAAASFNITTLRHFYCAPGGYGAGATVTTAIGFEVATGLANAAVTNVRAFVGNLTAGTNRYNLYMAGSAMNFLNGHMGLGTTPATSRVLDATGLTVTGSTTSYGARVGCTIAADVTATFRMVSADGGTVNGSNAAGLNIYNNVCSGAPSVLAGTLVSSYFGYREEVSSQSIATNMYSYWGQMAKEAGGNFLSFTARTISNVDVTSNVVTVTTSAAHGFVVGQQISHSFGTNTQLNGTKVIVATPTSTTYTFAQTTADVASIADTGPATPIKKWGVYSSGTANNYLGGSLLIGSSTPNDCAALLISSTTQGVLLPVHTTTQKNAVTNPTDGLVVYDTTLDRLALRANGVWVDLQPRQPRIQTVANVSTLTITIDTIDGATNTGQTGNLTIAAPTGTPVDGQDLYGRIKDAGVAKTITWNTIFRGIGVALPSTTVANKTLYWFAKYNSADSKWDVIDVKQEA